MSASPAFADQGDTPPTHRINLSLPASVRYAALATAYRPQLLTITSLLEDLVLLGYLPSYLPKARWFVRRLLRRIYDEEENAEIRGIAEATGIEVYLVVALNVLLDVLMGCTSGAALASAPPDSGQDSELGGIRMLHFRSLDWNMPALRHLLVKLDFVADDKPDSPVLAISITYVGFVGVLTGVRRGLSVSLNSRPNHDDSSWVKQMRYYGGHLAVLLGRKRSISSMIRELIIPSLSSCPEERKAGRGGLARLFQLKKLPRQAAQYLSLPDTISRIVKTTSTACYLILSDGCETYVLEKDYKTAKVVSSSSFIVATNNDRDMEMSQQISTGAKLAMGEPVSGYELIEGSFERRACMEAHWDEKVSEASQIRELKGQTTHTRSDLLDWTRSSQTQEQVTGLPLETRVTTTLDEIVSWTTTYPVTNELTHFTAVMDPARGTVAWLRRYSEPLDCGCKEEEVRQ